MKKNKIEMVLIHFYFIYGVMRLCKKAFFCHTVAQTFVERNVQ